MNPSFRNTLIALFILLIIGGGWYVVMLQREKIATEKQVLDEMFADTSAASDSIVAAKEANSAGLSPEAAVVASTAAEASFSKVYTNTQYGFSFQYPETLTIGDTTAPTDEATTILAQDVTSHVGFQIYITPFTDSDPVITADRVQQSLPDVVMQEAQPVQVSGSNQGLSFLTKDASFGESRQVWFVYNGNLYQISTYSSQSVLLEKILTTWIF